jgi:hypothetical protein
MAYTANLLLRTLPAIEHELNAPADASQHIIIDIPGPNRDWPKDVPDPKIFSGIPGVDPMPVKETS